MSLNILLQWLVRREIAEASSKDIKHDLPAKTIVAQQHVFFGHYDRTLRQKVRLNSVPDHLDIFVPRVDYYLSVRSDIDESPKSQAALSGYFDAKLLKYMELMNARQLFWQYGHTVNLTKYCLNIPALALRYIWIPKNACTTVKTELLKRIAPEFLAQIPQGTFHESVSARFGASIDDLDNANLEEVAFVRHPIERLVSCYIDKFVNPIFQRRDFEEFASRHISRIYELFKITADPMVRSASFSEFLSYILNQPAWAYDAHWRPQAEFLGSYSGRKLYRTESVERMLRDLRLGINDPPPQLNSSSELKWNETAPLTGRLFDKNPGELQKADITSYNDFVPGSVYRALEAWLERDFELFENAGKGDVRKLGTKDRLNYPRVVSVVARSEVGREGERAWVSLVTERLGTERRDYVLITHFKVEDFGEKAWPRAVTYGKQFAKRLGIPFRKKRDTQPGGAKVLL